ncbi:daf-12-interacting protein 1-like isoform X2 [Acanthaster planci]|uniref:Daf-12-interacting protein 1-like isoform X2 n=1 Tax=Acanthaster planci TaxID=133434 RepID=A0A8B7Z791_ACAPL|nr:daf-12-interacting protein 1-like isoform X2 [Acanthaster planci]
MDMEVVKISDDSRNVEGRFISASFDDSELIIEVCSEIIDGDEEAEVVDEHDEISTQSEDDHADERSPVGEIDEIVGENVEEKNSRPAVGSTSNEEYDELCDAVEKRATKLADSPECARDEDLESLPSHEEELQDVGQQQQQMDNTHIDLVTPELSAEEKESMPMPPRLSHKKSLKKKSPSAEHSRKSGRKLDYQSSNQVPEYRAIRKKLLPKSNLKPSKKKTKQSSKKRKLQERTVHQEGTWVQCMRSECLKWRYLSEVTDPSLLPEYWVCEMNTDPHHNSCEHPEEDYHSLKFVFTKFAEGSIVWAKMQGFPWWPAMIEEDPDTGTYMEQEDENAYPTHYHVVFLDRNVSRTWLKSTFIKKYNIGEDEQTYAKGRDYKHQVSQAVARANMALSMNIQERICTFGFSHNFKGKIVDNSQEFAQEETIDCDADQIESDEDGDAELSLEMLGLDVDDILEEAEALLSEAGETIQSLQETSLNEEAKKETKKRRKSKKAVDVEECTGQIEMEEKTKRQRKDVSPKDADGNKKEREKKKRKSRHHHSRKEATVVDDSTTYEPQELTQPKINSNKMKREDGSTKRAERPRSKKSCFLKDTAKDSQGEDKFKVNQSHIIDTDANPNEKKGQKPRVKKSAVEVISKTQRLMAPAVILPKAGELTERSSPEDPSEELQEFGKSDPNAEPKEKKVKRPRMKKPANNLDPKAKKVRAKKQGATQLNSENFDETDNPKEGSKTVQEDGKSDNSSKPKIKKSRAKKPSADKPRTEDLQMVTPAKNTAKFANKTKSQKNQEAKAKINSHEGCPEMKLAFEPPSRNTREKKPKRASFAVPLIKKDNMPSDKIQREATTEDEQTDILKIQTNDSVITMEVDEDIERGLHSHPKQHELVTSQLTSNRSGTGGDDMTRQKVKKFSIKTKSDLSSPNSSTPSSGKPATDANRGSKPSPSLNWDAVHVSSSQKTRNKKPCKSPSRNGASQKFSIKHKTPILKDPSAGPSHSTSGQLRSKTSPEINDNSAAGIEAPSVNVPMGKMKKCAPKKFSVKRKPQPAAQEATRLELGIDDKDSIFLSPPKKMKAERYKIPVEDKEEFHLGLNEDLIVDDAALVKEKQGDGKDDGEDSDDFSMEDLEDWPENSEMVDEGKQGDPNKLNGLTTIADANSQPVEVVEE